MSTVTEFMKDCEINFIQKHPFASKIYAALRERGEIPINDHIALRTVDLPEVNIHKLSQIFISLGYTPQEEMFFKEKKLRAVWFKPPDWNLPKVFISELLLNQCSSTLTNIIKYYVSNIEPKHLDLSLAHQNIPTLLLESSWPIPSYTDYKILNSESEYAAWVIAFGNQVNHVTLFVNALKTFTDLHDLNIWLQHMSIPLNDAGGSIKGTPLSKLMQSATIANRVHYEFSDGIHTIPFAYVEFAQRFAANEKTVHESLAEPKQSTINEKISELFHGFLADNADKIFESTFISQAQRLP